MLSIKLIVQSRGVDEWPSGSGTPGRLDRLRAWLVGTGGAFSWMVVVGKVFFCAFANSVAR